MAAVAYHHAQEASERRLMRLWHTLARFRGLSTRGPAISELASRPDGRLLRDIGLSRAEALGLEGMHRLESEAMRRLWTL